MPKATYTSEFDFPIHLTPLCCFVFVFASKVNGTRRKVDNNANFVVLAGIEERKIYIAPSLLPSEAKPSFACLLPPGISALTRSVDLHWHEK